MRAALLGTGLMSAPMGRNLVAAGHAVHAWNRTRARAETIDVGPEAGTGERVKRLGVPPEKFFAVIEGGAMFAPYAKLKGTNMIERRYEPNVSLKLARKDAEVIAAAAADLPLAQLISERMAAAIAAGHGDDDFSAVVEAGRP